MIRFLKKTATKDYDSNDHQTTFCLLSLRCCLLAVLVQKRSLFCSSPLHRVRVVVTKCGRAAHRKHTTGRRMGDPSPFVRRIPTKEIIRFFRIVCMMTSCDFRDREAQRNSTSKLSRVNPICFCQGITVFTGSYERK
jgi:hypothetical protein